MRNCGTSRRQPAQESHVIPPGPHSLTAQKPQNINDLISKPETPSGELRAKLLGGGAWPGDRWAADVTNVVKLAHFETAFNGPCYKRRQSAPKNHYFQRKSRRIDDVCNNTHRGIPKSQHDEADHIRRTGGHGWGAHGRRQGLARQRADAPNHTQAH